MIRAMTIALAICIPSAAKAATWVFVGESNDDSVWYLDSETVMRNNSYMYVWAKIDQSANTRVSHHESKVRFKINCTAQTMQWVYWIDYDADGLTVSTDTQPDYSSGIGMKPVAPETVAFALVQKVCRPPS